MMTATEAEPKPKRTRKAKAAETPQPEPTAAAPVAAEPKPAESGNLKLTADRKALLDVCKWAAAACPARKGACPKLDNLQLATVGETSLSVSGTDLDAYAAGRLPATVGKPGVAQVNAELLVKALGKLTSESVELESDGDRLLLSDDRCELEFPVASEVLPPAPDLSKPPACKVMAGVLGDLFRRVNPAVASEEANSRYAMRGVHWLLGGGVLELQGTDGRAFAAARGPAPFQSVPTENQVVIPQAAFKLILDGIDDPQEEISVWFDQGSVYFRSSAAVVAHRLLEGRYPDGRKACLESHKTQSTYVVPAGKLLQVVGQAAVVDHKVKVTADPDHEELRLEAEEKGRGNVSVRLPLEDLPTGNDAKEAYKPGIEGKDRTVLNAGYLTDNLKALDGDTVLTCKSGGNTPFVVEAFGGDYFLCLVPLT